MKHMLILSFLSLMVACHTGGEASPDLPLLKISDSGRHLVTGEGQPFFWLGGTAWEMLHRLNREEINSYLEDRAAKGFTVIQTVILAELDGLHTPNAYGHLPFIDNDPAQLNDAYFELVDDAVQRAGELGMYVGLLPTWGDKINLKWGTGPEIFTEANARAYGRLLAERYESFSNIIWILGGDRPLETDRHHVVIEAMAQGIREIDVRHLITFHPVGAKKARDFIESDWLDFDMYQSGHSRDAGEYRFAADSRALQPVKPVINGEACYENIPDSFWEDKPWDWMDDGDVRVSAYRSMLAGAAGYTYGCNDIWQMWSEGHEPVIGARTGWKAALDLPGSTQVGHLRKFFESIDWTSLQPEQSLILNENPEGPGYMMAARSSKGAFILAYTPEGVPLQLDLSGIQAAEMEASWFNPRSGRLSPIGKIRTGESMEFTPWSHGRGSDFLLLLQPLLK